jgi:HEAT repeat protein
MMKNMLSVLLLLPAVLVSCSRNAREEPDAARPERQEVEQMPVEPAVSDAERLIEILRHEDTSDNECEDVAKQLSDKGETAIEPLIRSLEDKDWRVRYYAARALGWMRWKDDRALEPLVEDSRVVEALIQSLDDEDFRVRRNVCWAFAKIKDERATEPLTRVLGSDIDSSVRAMAAWALG